MLHLLPYLYVCFPGERCTAKAESWAIINDIKRMTSYSVSHGKMSFKISLPHFIGFTFFKSDIRRCNLTCFLCYQPIAFKNIIDGSWTRNICYSLITEHTVYFSCTYRRILFPVFYNEFLNFIICLVTNNMRCSTLIT